MEERMKLRNDCDQIVRRLKIWFLPKNKSLALVEINTPLSHFFFRHFHFQNNRMLKQLA